MSGLVELPAAGSRERSHGTSLAEKDDCQKRVGSPPGPGEISRDGGRYLRRSREW